VSHVGRRAFVAGGAAAVVGPLAVEAQPSVRVPRVGVLSYVLGCDNPAFMTPFREGLRASGYVEGQTVLIECRGGPRTGAALAESVAELVHLKVDVIVAEGTAWTLAAKRATATIPIVMVYVADPVGSGLVASLARPGGNVTGLSVLSPGIVQKALEVVKEVVPHVSRVGVWMDPNNPGQRLLDEQLDGAARVLGLSAHRVEVRSAAGLDAAFAAALAQRSEVLFVYPLPIGPADRQRLAEFAIAQRLPTVAITPLYVEAGLLLTYGVRGADQYRRAGAYIAKILRGARPADLPVEQPTTFELAINLKTAGALGLTIPRSLLLRADRVIE
jgi:putative ABC transport system substrate-binding protein